jgi:hypothetical protein
MYLYVWTSIQYLWCRYVIIKNTMWALPKLQLAIFTLPPSSAFNAILKYIPSCPIFNLARIFILSNVTRAVG